MLHHIKGRTLRETATAMDRSHASAAGLLHRGLRKLRKLLEAKSGVADR